MIIKIILLGMCVCLLNIFLKQTQGVFVIAINLCFVVIVSFILLDYAAEAIGNIKELLTFSSSSKKMFTCLYKGAIMCVVTKVSCDLCKESGNIVVSDIIDLTGRIMLIIIAYPFIESIIQTAASFLL